MVKGGESGSGVLIGQIDLDWMLLYLPIRQVALPP